MCLVQISPKRSRDKFLKGANRRGYIRVYKVCEEGKTGWYTGTPYRDGLQEASPHPYFYHPDGVDVGFHAYLSLYEAEKTRSDMSTFQDEVFIKTCYAKPKWLNGLSLRTKEASFTHLVFPDWDKGDMTIREFRNICNND